MSRVRVSGSRVTVRPPLRSSAVHVVVAVVLVLLGAAATVVVGGPLASLVGGLLVLVGAWGLANLASGRTRVSFDLDGGEVRVGRIDKGAVSEVRAVAARRERSMSLRGVRTRTWVEVHFPTRRLQVVDRVTGTEASEIATDLAAALEVPVEIDPES